MSPEWHLRIAGSLQLLIAALHLAFPARFSWHQELARLSLLNRQLFHVHTLFVCVVVLMFGALSLLAPAALLERGPLARLVLVGISGFWGLRLYCQWFVFERGLWRGNTFNTMVQALLTLLWFYLMAVYAWARLSLG